MAMSRAHDIGAVVTVRGAIANTAATAAGAGDSTSVTGASVDLTTLGARFNAAALCIGNQATITSGQSFSVRAAVQDSANDSDWADLVASSTVYTQSATGAAVTAQQRGGDVNVDLSKARQFIRAVVTPDLSHAGTDTATVSAVWVFGYPDKVG